MRLGKFKVAGFFVSFCVLNPLYHCTLATGNSFSIHGLFAHRPVSCEIRSQF